MSTRSFGATHGQALATIGLALSLIACASGPNEGSQPTGLRRVPLGKVFSIAVGETVAVEGTAATVRLAAVLEDNRCPRDVVCIQAGRARVRLEVAGAGAPATVELSTMPQGVTAAAGGLELELRDVTPGPVAGRTTPPDEIRAELVASESAPD